MSSLVIVSGQDGRGADALRTGIASAIEAGLTIRAVVSLGPFWVNGEPPFPTLVLLPQARRARLAPVRGWNLLMHRFRLARVTRTEPDVLNWLATADAVAIDHSNAALAGWRLARRLEATPVMWGVPAGIRAAIESAKEKK